MLLCVFSRHKSRQCSIGSEIYVHLCCEAYPCTRNWASPRNGYSELQQNLWCLRSCTFPCQHNLGQLRGPSQTKTRIWCWTRSNVFVLGKRNRWSWPRHAHHNHREASRAPYRAHHSSITVRVNLHIVLRHLWCVSTVPRHRHSGMVEDNHSLTPVCGPSRASAHHSPSCLQLSSSLIKNVCDRWILPGRPRKNKKRIICRIIFSPERLS